MRLSCLALLLCFGLGAVPARAVDEAPRSYCPGAEVPIDTKVASAPFVYMRYGTQAGAFLLDTGTEHTEIDSKLYKLSPNTHVSIVGSSFPTISLGHDIWVEPLSRLVAPTPMAGIIGTDYLGTRTIEFHYVTPNPYLVVSETPCPMDKLRAAGFVAIDQTGYFGDTSRDKIKVNTPSIFARLGSVVARTWIDSGYKEFTTTPPPGVVEVNDNLLEVLRKAGIAMHRSGSVESTVCSGEKFMEDLWQVDKEPLRLTDLTGAAVFWEGPPPVLDVIKTHVCKGSGAISGFGKDAGPLAMIGAVFLQRWGVTILDPLNRAVWLRTPPKP